MSHLPLSDTKAQIGHRVIVFKHDVKRVAKERIITAATMLLIPALVLVYHSSDNKSANLAMKIALICLIVAAWGSWNIARVNRILRDPTFLSIDGCKVIHYATLSTRTYLIANGESAGFTAKSASFKVDDEGNSRVVKIDFPSTVSQVKGE